MQKIAGALTAGDIPYEFIDGLAVLIHVEESSPEHATLTRDVNLLVRRMDLEWIKNAAARQGFQYRHAAGVDMLLYGSAQNVANAVHLVFSGEKVRPNYLIPAPPIEPEKNAHP
ncbi:MAG TPA: hypothetical protein VG675_05405 [Bryobacteraceae bacterium]|nr:hypothetical protein [Bryobacteraceae bacterium]